MARGYEMHRLRRDAVASLGRILCRRAVSRCELCEAAGVSLQPVEVPPVDEDPDPARALLLCSRCVDGVLGNRLDPLDWRFLDRAAWSDLPVVQVAAVRLLRRLAAAGAGWAADVLENLYLDPEVEEWVDSGARN